MERIKSVFFYCCQSNSYSDNNSYIFFNCYQRHSGFRMQFQLYNHRFSKCQTYSRTNKQRANLQHRNCYTHCDPRRKHYKLYLERIESLFCYCCQSNSYSDSNSYLLFNCYQRHSGFRMQFQLHNYRYGKCHTNCRTNKQRAHLQHRNCYTHC